MHTDIQPRLGCRVYGRQVLIRRFRQADPQALSNLLA